MGEFKYPATHNDQVPEYSGQVVTFRKGECAGLSVEWEGDGRRWMKVVAAEDVPVARPGVLRVGRNTACPCGSGRKFKRCCGGR